MCGLIGMAGVLDHELRNRIMKDMLDACASRGRDSTGVVRVGKGGGYDYAKQVGPPAYLYDSRLWDRHIDGEAQALIGHTRSKTVGDVSRRNAHPFDFPAQGIIGVHNGTLRNHYTLDTHAHGKVDSEVMYGHMAKNGVEDTFKKVEGAYACVWWDNDAGTLNFFRNTERPLWFTWSDDFKTMFWASEIWMFGAVARKKKLWSGGEKGEIYHEIPPQTLWSFRINTTPKADEKVMSLRPVLEIHPEKKTFQVPTRAGGNLHTNSNGSYGSYQQGRWVETSPGVRERTFEPVGFTTVGNREPAGTVTNPFIIGKPDANEKTLESTPPVAATINANADLPQIQGDGTTSQLSNVEFLRSSVQRSGSKTEPNSTPSSKKNTLYLPSTTSNVYPMVSKGKQSETCPGSKINSKKEGVSFRCVAGEAYVTWNATGREFSEAVVMANVKGRCTFCKTTLMEITDIAEFVDEHNVLCTDCIQEPQHDALCEVC